MTQLTSQPVIYEIDTWVWLHELSAIYSRDVTLADVPSEIWDEIAKPGIDAVWLMGVWERSPAGIRVARQNESMLEAFHKALPDFSDTDVVGSPYCVRRYAVDEHLGSANGLARARNELAARGLNLVLDFVPNHVAIDNPWTTEHPEYFLQAPAGQDFDVNAFVEVENRELALGRDPYFPPWPDVVQLNAFSVEVRKATTATLMSIAEKCDGVRCDMAMLFVNDVFARTWQGLAGQPPESEFWPGIIDAVKQSHTEFTFIAEAYWDMESVLLSQGFDYCYDKRLYDRLRSENAGSVKLHLGANIDYQQRMVRFLENHDEPRAAATFGARERAAAVATALLPGAKLYYDGQFDGRKIFDPVALGRRPTESNDHELNSFYSELIAYAARHRPGADWRLADSDGWPDNQSHQDLLAWTSAFDDERSVVIINYSGHSSQGNVRLPWSDLEDRQWNFLDEINRTEFKRDGNDLAQNGLFVDLEPWHYHVLIMST